jgi:trans-2,3-dihydro-3-hydroxyanthranilate isomerase
MKSIDWLDRSLAGWMVTSARVPDGDHEDLRAAARAQADPFVILDVFTDTPLQGNQLGVFTHGEAIGAERMQALARELGFSETVFLLPARGGADARMRIFTPSHELPFAGHPVLGTAFVVGEALGTDSVDLETGAGVVPVALRRAGGRIREGTMAQPVPAISPFAREAELLAALGVATSGLPVEQYRNGPVHAYVELEDASQVAALEPDMRALTALEVCANCFAGEDDDGARFKTRMFAPAFGVAEDAATGSAAGPLAVHLARHGRIAFGSEIEISQGVEIGRPSLLRARVYGSAGAIERVEVSGSAVIVARGEFTCAAR